MSRLKKQLSVANVLSCMALFVALGGVAVAAKATLTKNQVKAKNVAKEAITAPKLKNGAVISAKLATGSVINSKLANGAVTSGKLANSAVTAAKLANQSVTTGKLGQEAVAGGKLGKEAVTGDKVSAALLAQLIKNVTYVNAESATNNEGAKSVTALCPAGKQAIGGGARVNGELEEIAVTGSNPFVAANGQRTGWSAFGRELPDEAGAKKWAVEAFAVCAEL